MHTNEPVMTLNFCVIKHSQSHLVQLHTHTYSDRSYTNGYMRTCTHITPPPPTHTCHHTCFFEVKHPKSRIGQLSQCIDVHLAAFTVQYTFVLFGPEVAQRFIVLTVYVYAFVYEYTHACIKDTYSFWARSRSTVLRFDCV
jgi:hypothetical protein